ncbi:MAG: DEAD/DEAH box helicase family protein [Nitrospinae bacterium]|nr:DEAD/DEAH box helicase family protein [Nitrospinota bacterium]
MELREYQQKALQQVGAYLEALGKWREKNRVVIAAAGKEAALNVPERAWEEVSKRPYHSRKNGMGESIPNFCVKIPTGGGKTLLAVKIIDQFFTTCLKKQTGVVLWVVPTTQIYNQTLKALRDRDHPYRQHLDMASAGRTMILEKWDKFTPSDTLENLVVMLLMLPSAARQNKETLKVFKDSSGFDIFFPPEDDAPRHKALLEKVPNLDAFNGGDGFWGAQIKTSLGNTLRILSPLIILDEGHKAYSENAQGTLYGFNPCGIVELSATPDKTRSNILVEISGVELNREGMIKLDLHIINKTSPDWKDTLLEAVRQRDALEKKSNKHAAEEGAYIRPICLIQVERTGKEQRGGRFIHAEDAVEYLKNTCNIPPERVAVKSSEKDDIEGIDLLARDCHVRYIITKQALQEGWDCSFAYVLAILTNPSSKNSLTQLVGRILRQPYARKTGVKELDESYVFCFKQKGKTLLDSIRDGFARDGLGDLASSYQLQESVEDMAGDKEPVAYRERFRHWANKIYLPVFAIRADHRWRQVKYETDIISRIDWSKADFSPLADIQLSLMKDTGGEILVNLSEDQKEVIRYRSEMLREGNFSIDPAFLSRHLADIIPNPWECYQICDRVLKTIAVKTEPPVMADNLVTIVEELRKRAEEEKERLSRLIFLDLLEKKTLRFFMLKDEKETQRLRSSFMAPKEVKRLTRENGEPLQRSLFEIMPENGFNDLEKSVAWYLEEQERLLFWYKGIARVDYYIQGWRQHRVWPDFIFTDIHPKNEKDFAKVFIVETKGFHLENNDDTNYKKDIFKLCQDHYEEKSWSELSLEFPEKKVRFSVIKEEEWRQRINEFFAA